MKKKTCVGDTAVNFSRSESSISGLVILEDQNTMHDMIPISRKRFKFENHNTQNICFSVILFGSCINLKMVQTINVTDDLTSDV